MSYGGIIGDEDELGEVTVVPVLVIAVPEPLGVVGL